MTRTDTRANADRLLRSPSFTRCRIAAAQIEGNPAAIRALLADVAVHRFGAGNLSDTRDGREVDVACAAVEAHLARAEDCDSPAENAFVRLLLAALLYLVTDNDVIPDLQPYGHLDDIAVLRWANGVARDAGVVAPADPDADADGS